MKIRYCLFCEKELRGRADKKFCDTQCRSSYHNTHKSLHEQIIHKTNSALRKNRSLLAHFCPEGKTTVRKEVLKQLGYNFTAFTHIFPFRTGTCFFCYDYGFLPVLEKGIEKMVIVKGVHGHPHPTSLAQTLYKIIENIPPLLTPFSSKNKSPRLTFVPL